MEKIKALALGVLMISLCLAGCLGSEDNTEDDVAVESIMQMMIDEEDFPVNWHKYHEIMSTGSDLWNCWMGQDFRECAQRHFSHYFDNESLFYDTVSMYLFSYSSEQKAAASFNHTIFEDFYPTWRVIDIGDEGGYYNSSSHFGYHIRVESFFLHICFFSYNEKLDEYMSWSDDLVEDQIAKIRDMLPFWVGYESPVCFLEINTDINIVPSNVTFIIKFDEGDGAIVNWSLDIDSDGIPEYSGEGQPPQSINRTYETPVSFVATLKVTDVQGDQANSSKYLRIYETNDPPRCHLSALPENGEAPLEVAFYINVYDLNDDPIRYELDIDGDGEIDFNGTIPGGQSSQTRIGYHTYETPGEYQINLSVSDGRGGNSSASATIIVT
jgi:hypothetical protein